MGSDEHSYFKSIFIGPFKISTDNYHAVDDVMCMHISSMDSPTEKRGDPFYFKIFGYTGWLKKLLTQLWIFIFGYEYTGN